MHTVMISLSQTIDSDGLQQADIVLVLWCQNVMQRFLKDQKENIPVAWINVGATVLAMYANFSWSAADLLENMYKNVHWQKGENL